LNLSLRKGRARHKPDPNSHDAERLGSFREPQPSSIRCAKAEWRIDITQIATLAIDGNFLAGTGVISGMDSVFRLVLFGLVAIGVAFALALTFNYLP
jgi:hypothetical protein